MDRADEVDELIEALKARRPEDRRRAAVKLGSLGAGARKRSRRSSMHSPIRMETFDTTLERHFAWQDRPRRGSCRC